MATGMTKLSTLYAAESSGIPKVTQAVYDRNLLERALPLLVFDKFGQQRPLKRRSGTSMVFRKYDPLTAVSSALNAEGAPDAAQQLSKTEVVATIAQYGNWVEVSDLADVASLDDIIMEATTILGENMAESLDTIYREKLITGSQVLYSTGDGAGSFTAGVCGTWTSGGSNRATVDGVLTKAILDKTINILERNKAKKFTGQVNASTGVSTYPVAPAYWMIIHPDQVRDLYEFSFSGLVKGGDFTPVEQYSAQTQVMDGEVGKYRSLRFIATTQCKIVAGAGGADSADKRRETSSACDVYLNLAFGQNAYGIVPLDGLNSRTIVERAGGVTDPLHQVNTIGWKAATAVALIGDEYLVRVEAASLL